MEPQKQTTKAQPTAAEQTPLDQAVAATAARQRGLVERAGAFLGVPPARVFEVLRAVWTTSKGQPPLTDQEIKTGLALVARYELDPFAREIYVTRGKDGPMTVLGIDGWIKILDRTDHYDGFQVEIFTDDGMEDGEVTAVETRIYSTKRLYPAVYRAFAHEYAKLGGFMLGKIPIHMLRIFSFRHAARLFVPLGGVVTEEEAAFMAGYRQHEVEPVASLDQLAEQLTAPEPEPASDPPRSDEVIAAQDQLANEFAGELAKASTAGRVQQLDRGIDRALAAGEISNDQYKQLSELVKAAKDRLSK
jgi:hypothetical protein